MPGNLGGVAGSPDDVWIYAGCATGGDPGALVHLYTASGGGIELSGGDEIPLESVASRLARPGVPQPAVASQCGLAAADNSAWITANVPPGVVRVDYDPAAVDSRVVWARPLPRAPTALAVGAGSVWAVDGDRDVIRRIDPETGRVDAVVRAGADPVAVAADDGAVWVARGRRLRLPDRPALQHGQQVHLGRRRPDRDRQRR